MVVECALRCVACAIVDIEIASRIAQTSGIPLQRADAIGSAALTSHARCWLARIQVLLANRGTRLLADIRFAATGVARPINIALLTHISGIRIT